MNISDKKSRSDLTAYFKKNNIPTEQNFAEFISATLNQRDDGIFKPSGDPLSVEAAKKPHLPLLNFYEEFADTNPSWFIGLGDGNFDASNGPEQGFVRGFAVGNPAVSSTASPTTRFFIASDTGNVGIGTVAPSHRLHVAGSLKAETADIVGALNAQSTATIGNDLTANKDVIVKGALKADTTATVKGAFNAQSTATIGDVLTANKDVIVKGALQADTTATVKGAFNVQSTATIGDVLTANKDVIVKGALNAQSTATIAGVFNAQSTATITGALNAQSTATITGALNAQSTATITGALNAQSTATIGDVLTANKDVVVKGALKADTTATIAGALSAESTATIGDVLTANKDVIVKGALNAQSTATIAGVFNAQSTATITGALNAQSTATITGALNAQSTATIDGVLTTNKLVTANEGLTVAAGKTTVQELQANALLSATKGLTVVGTTTLQEFRIDNQTPASVNLEVNSDGLKLTGAAVKVNGNLEVTGKWTLAGVPITKIVQEVAADATDVESIPTEAAVKSYVTSNITAAKPPTTNAITAASANELTTATAVKDFVTSSISAAGSTSIPDGPNTAFPTTKAVKTYVDEAIPIGAILMWSGAGPTAPKGWALCNGDNGTPDLRGQFILSYGKGPYEQNKTNFEYKKHGGAETIALTSEHMPSHKHDVGVSLEAPAYSSSFLDGVQNAHYAATGDSKGAEVVLTQSSLDNMVDLSFAHTHAVTVTENSKGSGVAHNNMPPYFVLAFIMRIS